MVDYFYLSDYDPNLIGGTQKPEVEDAPEANQSVSDEPIPGPEPTNCGNPALAKQGSRDLQ